MPWYSIVPGLSTTHLARHSFRACNTASFFSLIRSSPYRCTLLKNARFVSKSRSTGAGILSKCLPFGLFVGDGIFHLSGQCIVTSKSIVGASHGSRSSAARLSPGCLGCTWSPAYVGATGHLNGDGCNGLPDRPRAAFASAFLSASSFTLAASAAASFALISASSSAVIRRTFHSRHARRFSSPSVRCRRSVCAR